MSWSIGPLKVSEYVPTENKKTGEVGFIPMEIRRVPLIHHNQDGTTTEWGIACVCSKKGLKFSIHYPPSVVDVDKRGYYRPNGTKEVKNCETGLDGSILIRRLNAKFGKEFTRKVLMAIKA